MKSLLYNYYNVMATSKDARAENSKINYGMDTTGEKE